MNADQRLDQLEPVLAEAITVLDRHTLQLKQLNTAVGTLTSLMTKQSDNISFLLAENVHIKDRLTKIETDVAGLKTDVAELKTDVAGLKTDVAGLKTDVAGLKTDVAELKTDVAELKTDVAGLKTDVAELKQGQLDMNGKLDLILSKLK